MKRTIRFSKLFLPAAIISILLVSAGIAGYFILGGFNLGVDFQAGLIQEVQFAPTAIGLTWSGRGNATIAFDRSNMHIVNSGAGSESRTVTFPFSEYTTIGALSEALESQIEGLSVQLKVPEEISTQWLVRSAQGDPQLGSIPFPVHYLDPQSEEISIATVREAVTSLGQTVSVQILGQPKDRHFMLRLEDKKAEREAGDSATVTPAEMITSALERYFGNGEVVVLRSDYVDSRFSKNLTDQAGILIAVTLLLILLYSIIRFKPQFAIAAIIGILHDSFIVVAFVIWTRMEFNTTTIAAVLTILGYSINSTIVVFDRIRENRRLYPDEVYVNVLNRSLTETMTRTIITTLTTMLAIVSLYLFTTGSMKDFALALLVGLLSGAYTTTFISSGFTSMWDNQRIKKENKKITAGKAAKTTAVKTTVSKA